MVKFYKPGKVVVILNGRHAGRKGIIIKSNYENGKERNYPHCLVIGLSKGPKKATKKNIKKIEEQIKQLEQKDKVERIQKLKRLGIFIKTYNMSHLLVTRYTVKENFGIEEALKKVENAEKLLKEANDKLKKDQMAAKRSDKEDSRRDDEKKKGQEENDKLKAEIKRDQEDIGKKKDAYKEEIGKLKESVGTEMLNRFMLGFVSGKTAEEKEREEHTHDAFPPGIPPEEARAEDRLRGAVGEVRGEPRYILQADR
jgi:large subunit ribosomal protein L27e